VEFLIRGQSGLSSAMSVRDIDDAATAHDLAERAGTVERLRLLTLMTYGLIAADEADARISWRLEQLWRAYTGIRRELIRELESDRIERLPDDLPQDYPKAAEFLRGFPSRYLRARSATELKRDLSLFESSRAKGAAVELDPAEGAYRLTVVAGDKPSLFAQLAGGISSFGMDILKAEAFANANGIALVTFVFADSKRMLQQNPSEADRLADLLQRIALGKTDARRLMRDRQQPGVRKRITAPQVSFDGEACPTATLVEFTTDDRPGLLYNLATVFSSNGCNIDVVLVDTKGQRAIDVFYVAHEGKKLSPEMQASLREELLAVC
jgi:[protein-PII] uridylyltransferase